LAIDAALVEFETLAGNLAPGQGGNVEEVWIRQARQGDQEAFARLVELYQRPVFNLCYRMIGDAAGAEDAAQETFVRAYTRLASYDPNRKFSSWLLAIAAHYCIDQLRRRRFNLVDWDDTPDSEGNVMPDPSPAPEEIILRHETEREVRQLLNVLPPDYRAAIILRYWQQLSYEEIAETLHLSLPAVKSRLFRARQLMARAVDSSEATRPSPRPRTHGTANPVSPAGAWVA
jgi:RNA polymerase sigma-70 factor (ECF subfamily)